MHHNGGFNTVQRTAGLLLVFCAFMIIPLSLGVAVLSKINSSGKNVSALTPVAPNKCDLNRDGQVTQADLEVAAVSFGQVKDEAGKLADIDGNGWVNSLDMLIISRNDPVRCQGASSSPVPSPVASSTPTPGGATCQVQNVTIQAGRSIGLTYKGFAAGESINIVSNTVALIKVGTTIDSLTGPKSTQFTPPATLQSGTYQVTIVTRFPVVRFACGTFTIQPIASPSPLSYNKCDFNYDGKVNEVDLEILAKYFQPDPSKMTEEHKRFDVNNNGVVNSLDQLIVARNNPQYCTNVVPTINQ